MDIRKESLKKHYEWNGKIEVVSRVPINSAEALSLAYTPGVAEPCLEIQKDYDKSFELACEGAGQGDFVFIDSPYAPLNPTSFESYTKEGFDIESHRRLSNLFDKLTNRGCYCMLTNHNTELINELYSGKGYRRDVVSVKRMINSDASKRVGEEIIICNY